MQSPPVIAVIGLGTMGLGIAQVFAQAGFSVLATDRSAAVRETAGARLSTALSARVAAGKLSADAADAALARLSVVPAAAEMGRAGLSIEAVAEDLAVKRAVLAALADAAPRAVLATNTSSLSVAAVAAGLPRPERVLGLHFFNPAPAMRLVELVAHAGTSPEALALARRLTEAAGKTVIACPDRPGFIVNRCARPFYGEALAMLEEGRSASDIDAAMLAAGYRIGPLSLIDLIGADVHLAATESLFAAMGRHPRYQVFDRLRAQVAAGALGVKAGRGFLYPDPPGAAPPDADALALRIEAVLANEAASLAAEGVAPEAIDTALRLGLNLPRGPFEAARARGPDRIRAELARLAAAAPPALDGRYALQPLLRTLD
jgi:3-hydroxybutyryl-CoA dehydrogenase